jgi:hypothetical protein
MKKPEDVMEILEAYDLTGSFRAAAGLVGCDHKTVAYWVRQRDEAGGMPVVERARPAMEAVFAAKIDELVDRSHGQIRADVAHGKLVAIGYLGSERTTRRWVADAKRRWRRKHGRRTRPWIPEPGLWMQWDYGDGPTVEGDELRRAVRLGARPGARTVRRPDRDRHLSGVGQRVRSCDGVPARSATRMRTSSTTRRSAGQPTPGRSRCKRGCEQVAHAGR